MRSILLAAILSLPVTAIAEIPQVEGTHLYRVARCGITVGVFVVTPDAVRVARGQNSARILAGLIAQMRHGDLPDGPVRTVRLPDNGECQRT